MAVPTHIFLALLLGAGAAHAATSSFTVGTYNLENYLDFPAEGRPLKTSASKAKALESIVQLRANVLALQEIGTTNALSEILQALRQRGLPYPYSEHVTGFDTNAHLAVLSEFPIVARRSHSNLSFLLRGRRFRVSRGFAEVDIQISPQYRFTLLAAHLKSRRLTAHADESELRREEAVLLRELIDQRLQGYPDLNLVVLGDFNDVRNSSPLRTLLGKGRSALVDTRPAERNGDNTPNPNPAFPSRNITWTHYYGVEDTYSRIDYILISRGMANEWRPEQTYLLALPDWGIGSDHRPIVAGFESRENSAAVSKSN